jgi:GT2 family glycosyltransferase
MKHSSLEQNAPPSTKESLPPTSLLICSRNRPKLLLEIVESVLQGDEVPTEIVIIDQSETSHPTLATCKPHRPCDIRYLQVDSVGLSRARNAGVASARHDILAFIDDDMLVSSAWFGSLIRAVVDSGPHTVVTGQVLQGAVEATGGFAPSLKCDDVPTTYQGRVGKDVLWAGNMAMYRSAIEEVGHFDERLGAGARFPGAEDNDFGFRLLEAGYRISYVPQAVVYHRAWRDKSKYLAMRWSYGRGEGGFYCKHLSLRDPYMLRRMVWDIVHRVCLFPYRVFTGPRRACGDVVYVLGILLGTAQWLYLCTWRQRE